MLGSKRRRVRQQDPDDSVIDQFRANRRAAQPGTSKLTPDSKWTTSDEEFVEVSPMSLSQFTTNIQSQ